MITWRTKEGVLEGTAEERTAEERSGKCGRVTIVVRVGPL